MKIRNLRLVGIRCFEDTGDISLDPRCNIFVGKNNAGKSTILKSISGLQGFPFDAVDVRPGNQSSCFATIRLDDVPTGISSYIGQINNGGTHRIFLSFHGSLPDYNDAPPINTSFNQQVFLPTRPNNMIVPFLARRKAVTFSHDISLGVQANVTGTLSNLYSRIDLLATYGHSEHDRFKQAMVQIVGVPITTKGSPGGKEAGFYFGGKFVTLEHMGDGVAEMAGLIVELCTEENKIFVLEEPEANLHPSGLKALLAMIRAASEKNQFIIATHSNVVVRELGGKEDGRVFRVFRDGESYTSPSKVEEVEDTPVAHMELLRELGYEFADFQLHDAWLFLEESSAESVIRDVLIPIFAPELIGKLRTYSANGVTNLEPSISDFHRLVVFVHLQPVYKDRFWIRADGDEGGTKAVAKIREKFPDFTEDSLATFTNSNFESYYPAQFQERVTEVIEIANNQTRRKQKVELLRDVLAWTNANKKQAIAEWKVSANEPIKLLLLIRDKLANQ